MKRIETEVLVVGSGPAIRPAHPKGGARARGARPARAQRPSGLVSPRGRVHRALDLACAASPSSVQ